MPKIGEPGGPLPGRKKGAANKTTALLKDAILKAAQAAGGGDADGVVKYLTIQAIDNPGPFMALLGKVLPLQVAGTDEDGEITELRLTIVDPRR